MDIHVCVYVWICMYGMYIHITYIYILPDYTLIMIHNILNSIYVCMYVCMYVCSMDETETETETEAGILHHTIRTCHA